MNAKEHATPGKYNRVEVPNGSWAVIINERKETEKGLDECDWLYPSLDIDVSFIGPRPNRILLNQTSDNDCTYCRCLYWHEQPFAIIERWESPMMGQWVHLASEVSAHGLTNRLPKFMEPSYVYSRAARGLKPELHAKKWARLSELATLIGVSPAELLIRHRHHYDGYDKGLILKSASDQEAMKKAMGYEFFNTDDNATFDSLTSSNLSIVWVRRGFVLVALYLHMLGYKP